MRYILVIRPTFISLVFLLSLSFRVGWAQSVVTAENAPSRVVKQLESAQESLADGELQKALEKIDKLLAAEPTFIDAYILKGEASYRAEDMSGAISALSEAVTLDTAYDARVLFTLSRLYEYDMRFSEAASNLAAYLRMGDIDADRRAELSKRLEILYYRNDMVSHPVPFDPRALPGNVNTQHDEALPSVTIDGSTMIFTRRANGYEDVFTAVWDSTQMEWTEVGPMTAINSPQNEGAHTISANGRVLVFTSCNRRDGVGSCDLYLTFQKSTGEWSEIRNLSSVNSRGWDGQPSLTADGRGLYFSSDRPGGFGQRDIWFTKITDAGWTEPLNLGPAINSSGNESSPFICRDDRTLYLMSDGHMGMGDYDLFISRKEDQHWSEPENLGYPINTPGREGALTVHPDGLTAYYTRQDEQLGTMDIYQFDLPPGVAPDRISYLKILVVDKESGDPVSSLAWIYELTDSTRRDRYVSDGLGQIEASLPHGAKFGIHVTAPGYAFYSDQFDLDMAEPYSKLTMKVMLQPISGDTADSGPVILRNVEFQSGSSRLLASSMTELKLLLELLNSRPDIKIEIRGHTDNIGDPASNMELSGSRARTVYEWLVAQGIESDRLTYKGFGELEPIASNDSIEGRQKNRRTEFVITH